MRLRAEAHKMKEMNAFGGSASRAEVCAIPGGGV